MIMFRMTSSSGESILGEDLFEYVILVSARTVDDYNDKFLMLSKGGDYSKTIYVNGESEFIR